MDSKKTETKIASIFKDNKGVIHVIIYEGAKIDYYDALDHYLVIKNLSGTDPVLKLIDSRANWSIQSKARKFLAGKEIKEKTAARAVLVKSSFKSVLLNFFSGLYRPGVPTRVFTDYNKAYEWLMQMKERKSSGQ